MAQQVKIVGKGTWLDNVENQIVERTFRHIASNLSPEESLSGPSCIGLIVGKHCARHATTNCQRKRIEDVRVKTR